MVTFLDPFTRADTPVGSGLGTVPGGPPYQAVAGSWRILANKAHCDTIGLNNPIVAARFGHNGRFRIGISNFGDCLYIRILNNINWIRLRYFAVISPTLAHKVVFEMSEGGVISTLSGGVVSIPSKPTFLEVEAQRSALVGAVDSAGFGPIYTNYNLTEGLQGFGRGHAEGAPGTSDFDDFTATVPRSSPYRMVI